LAIIIVDANKVEAKRGIAVHRPGCITGEKVDLIVLQRRKPLHGRKRRELNLGAVAVEHRCCNRAAEVDVKALPFTIVALEAESRKARIDAAAHGASALDIVQCRGTRRQSGHGDDGGTKKRFDIGFHVFPFSCFVVRGLPLERKVARSPGRTASFPSTTRIEFHYRSEVKSE